MELINIGFLKIQIIVSVYVGGWRVVQQSALYHVKHVGDSVMVWGGILVSGVGDLVEINGI